METTSKNIYKAIYKKEKKQKAYANILERRKERKTKDVW